MELEVGHILNNRFRVIRLLGQGGMASVYYAHDPVLNRYVALKQMMPEPEGSERAAEQMRKQFLREAQVLASLHHPNLPRVTDYFIDGGFHYLVMDYIEGQSLHEMLIANRLGFGEPTVLDWADELLSALEYIHKHNVIHRDIKPANIRRTTDGRIFLVDFGLAKPYNAADPRTMTMFHGLGTPEYAPPEQYDPAAHTDQRSDIYALGATLYHLFTGQAPISATRRTADPEAFRALRQSKAAISPAVEQVITRAMEIERAKRYATAAEMRAELLAARQGKTAPVLVAPAISAPLIPAPAQTAPLQPRRRRVAYAVAPVLVLIAILTGFAIRSYTNGTNGDVIPTTTLTPTATRDVSAGIPASQSATNTPTSTPTITPSVTVTSTGSLTATTTLTATASTRLTLTPAAPTTTDQPVTAVATRESRPAAPTATPEPPKPTRENNPPGQSNNPPGQNKTKDPPKGPNK
jgi:serine/threonine-protein kinase